MDSMTGSWTYRDKLTQLRGLMSISRCEWDLLHYFATQSNPMRPFFLTCLLGIALQCSAQQATFPVEGHWLHNSGEYVVEVSVDNGICSGKIAWLREPIDLSGEQRRDVLNKDPELRSRRVIGIPVLSGFLRDDAEWKSGKIYDYTSGNTYNARMEIDKDGNLRITGFYGILFFLGKTKKWARVDNLSEYGLN